MYTQSIVGGYCEVYRYINHNVLNIAIGTIIKQRINKKNMIHDTTAMISRIRAIQPFFLAASRSPRFASLWACMCRNITLCHLVLVLTASAKCMADIKQHSVHTDPCLAQTVHSFTERLR